MRIRCHQCGKAVTPDLPALEVLDAFVMCSACAEVNGQDGQTEGPESLLAQVSEPSLTVVNIEGTMLLDVDTTPEGQQQFLEKVYRLRIHAWKEFDRQLSFFKDAYLSMKPKVRQQFKAHVQALGQLQDMEAEGTFDNPFCLFRLDWTYRPLEPASPGSEYAGHYVGHSDHEVSLPKGLVTAMAAWEQGKDFRLESVADIQRYE